MPTSIPNSSEAVATTALSRPSFSRCSASRRSLRARLPWCARTTPSPSRSSSACVTRSARRRVLTNISVVRCPRINSAIRSCVSSQTSCEATGPNSSRGVSTARSNSRLCPNWRMRPPPLSNRRLKNAATRSIGLTVAERPMRCSPPGAAIDSSRSSDKARCAPRLSPAAAWISSTITVRAVRSAARLRPAVSKMNSDSGVVTRMCGGRSTIRRRSHAFVSPVRTAVRIAGRRTPRRAANAAISASGPERFFSMSLLSAFNGETYTTLVRSGKSPLRAKRTSRSRQIRNAAKVLPEPVGAESKTSRPARISGQPACWGSVGRSKRPANHSATSGSKSRKGIAEASV